VKRRIVLLAAAFATLAVVGWLAYRTHTNDQPPAAVGDVLFMTNRQMNESSAPQNRFGGRRGQLVQGRCRVGYRPIPLTRDLAGAVKFFVPTDFQAIETVELLDRAQFESALPARPEAPMVLFVHGYSYGFDKTCRMGANLQRMLGDGATVVMFSWPSDANPADYVADQVDVEWSVPALAGLIERLGARQDRGPLRILAHSLGSRGVLLALAWLELAGLPPPYAEHLVLLAPDYDTASFKHQFDGISRRVERITLYASANDTPLKFSGALHGYPRLGQAGDALTLIEGMATIDVSLLGRYHPSGHEYFFYHPIAADDLVESLLHARAPAERRHTRPRSRNGKGYFVLVRPDPVTQ